MSYFTSDVIAKEQLHGVAGAPTIAPTVAGIGGGSEIIIRRRKPKGIPNSLLLALREWLQFKVKEYD